MGKGEEIQEDGKTTGRAGACGVGDGPKCQTIQSIEALVGLLQRNLVCPDCSGVRHRGTDHSGVDPLRNTWPRAPIPPGGRKEGIEEAFRLGRLGRHMFMPPEATVKGETQVLRR